MGCYKPQLHTQTQALTPWNTLMRTHNHTLNHKTETPLTDLVGQMLRSLLEKYVQFVETDWRSLDAGCAPNCKKDYTCESQTKIIGWY